MCLAKPGFGSKRIRARIGGARPVHFRLLSDRPARLRVAEVVPRRRPVQFRVHSVEPYKLELWRYGLHKEFVRNLGWYDEHGPRAVMQSRPTATTRRPACAGTRSATPARPHSSSSPRPDRSGLYYFHAPGASRAAFFSFPLVVAPARPTAPVAVLASTNTWNAYNAFGGRSNYIIAAALTDDADRQRAGRPAALHAEPTTATGRAARDFAPLSFDRPEPYNHVRLRT